MQALILVDLQNDFFETGELPVPDAESLLPVINQLLTLPFYRRIALKDYHPQKHCSFASTHHKAAGSYIELPDGLEQKLWPDHCLQGSKGSDLAFDLDICQIDTIITKGAYPDVDSYSGFFDNGKKHKTALDSYLKEHQIKELFLAGLCTDY
ncbi:MAG: Nicotinamidase, partial [Chlamydiales bacterium]|nr:Nicotinamidase [Chlamydiales bacterium]